MASSTAAAAALGDSMSLGSVFKLVIVLTPAAFVAWFVAVLAGLSTTSVATVIVLRTIMVCLTLLLATRWWARGRAKTAGSPLVEAVVGALVAYLVCPASWAGSALAGQSLVERGPVSFALDLVLWVVVVIAAALSVPAAAGGARDPYRLT